jgi:hypothetical protein
LGVRTSSSRIRRRIATSRPSSESMVSMSRTAVTLGARRVQHTSPRIDQLLDTEKAMLLVVEFLVGQNPRVAQYAEFA